MRWHAWQLNRKGYGSKDKLVPFKFACMLTRFLLHVLSFGQKVMWEDVREQHRTD
jgi:hypothetical protein